jgi:DNA-binding MarR family transcriptional regulator
VILELQRATHATLHRLGVELAHLDLTPSDCNALANLANFAQSAGRDRSADAVGPARGVSDPGGPGCTISELAAAVGARPTTLTGVLDRLERRGLVARTARPGDRRSLNVGLTPEGARIAAEVTGVMAALERRALDDLPPAAAEHAAAVLHALTRAALAGTP